MSSEESSFDIAVIGMSGRFPAANNLDQFWGNLCAGVDSVSFFSDEELKEAGVDDASLTDASYVRASQVLEDPSLFDASFFGYSPREAQFMDPQHRLFLECAWEALEDAGYDADRYDGFISVYGGASMNTYLLFSGLASEPWRDYLPILIGGDKDFLATRVSYKLNLRGPSVTVQCGCSTSLVAVHMACQSLLSGESDMALAGGVSIRVPHRTGYFSLEGGIHSPDGHSRAFDANAKGTVFGNGAGIVVLKRLADAVADRDHIYAVIKGSAVNNDGSSKVGYTAPSVTGQSEVILAALANSGVAADTISYVEAHGSGTVLGDPIEMAALTSAFRAHTNGKRFCAIGSVKTNIGHLDAAAGVAGLIKACLSLHNKMIPPSLHFERPNPDIDFENSPFYVNTTLSEWRSQSSPRRAGVSALGVGGTNAHVILEEAPAPEVSERSSSCQILVLSAGTDTALDKAKERLLRRMRQHPDLNLADVAYTLQVGRRVLDHGCTIVCQDLNHAAAALETADPGSSGSASPRSGPADMVFMFPGQGAQYVNMGLELYQTERVFREQIDQCSKILKPRLSLDLRDVLYPDEAENERARQTLRQTGVTQPALFVFEYALARQWMAWGMDPKALVGHSIGEYVAACLAGVFSLEDALYLIALRGRLIQGLPKGAMLAIPLSELEVRPLLCDRLDLAVINTPSLCVVSGRTEDVDDLESRLSREQGHCRRLHTSHAFHSRMMDPILQEFVMCVEQVELNPPGIPFVSNVTGTWITSEEACNPHYWKQHLRRTVRFSDCLHTLLEDRRRIFLEVGPGRTLGTALRQHPHKTAKHTVLASTRHPKEQGSDVEFILQTLGQLWLAGMPIDWCALHADRACRRISLPTYPFERKHYWISGKKVSRSARRMHSERSAGPQVTVPFEPLSESNSGPTYLHPFTNGTEECVAAVWREVLGLERIGRHDNFFQLGGDSLVAVQVLAQIRSRLGIKLLISDVFKSPTISLLAKKIGEMSAPAGRTSSRKAGVDLAHALKRLGSI